MIDTVLRVGLWVAAYVLFMWCLMWPLRHASWLQSMRFEARRRTEYRWQSHYGGR